MQKNKNIIKRGNYFIYKNKPLGKGTFADAYLASSIHNTNELYACKMIDKKKVESIESANKQQFKTYIIKRLQQQIKVWKQLEHPNIVKFYEIIESTNSIYMMLQYCEQGTLQTFLNKNLIISNEIALEYSKQILNSCSYLYRKGIIHRDIKPANILMKKGQLKVSDFGLAKIIDKDEINTLKTGTVAGSPGFMAPQVLEGQKYNISCDVWSVGILIYRLFEGKMPLGIQTSFKSEVKILNLINQNEIVFTKQLNPKIKQVIKRMLQRDCQKRITMIEAEQIFKKIKI